MKNGFPVRSLVALSLVVSTLSGCSDRCYPVEGQVTVDGKPLRDGRIFFVPDKEKGNKRKDGGSAQIKDGSYSLSTQGKPGVPAGWYGVMVQTQYQGAPADAVELPLRYSDPLGSGLSVEVVPNPEPGRYDFKLQTDARLKKSKEPPPPAPRVQPPKS